MNSGAYSVLWSDHVFVAIFAIVFPIFGYFSYQKCLQRFADGELSRRKEYVNTIVIQWILALGGVFLWFRQNRDWGELGFNGHINGKFVLALVLAALIVGFLVAQLRTIQGGSAAILQKFEPAFAPLKPLLPHSTDELNAFYALSFTAGIVEELLWRGFLIWYLTHFVPIGVSALLSALLFGLAHAYQGIASVPKLSVAGLVLSGLYLLSGSLWIPMLSHVLGDLIQGRTAFEYFRPRK